MKTEYEDLFIKLEAAVDAHPRLRRLPEQVTAEPEIRVSRYGYTAEIRAQLKGSRSKKGLLIHGDSEISASAAVDDLIASLDHWASAQLLASNGRCWPACEATSGYVLGGEEKGSYVYQTASGAWPSPAEEGQTLYLDEDCTISLRNID